MGENLTIIYKIMFPAYTGYKSATIDYCTALTRSKIHTKQQAIKGPDMIKCKTIQTKNSMTDL